MDVNNKEKSNQPNQNKDIKDNNDNKVNKDSKKSLNPIKLGAISSNLLLLPMAVIFTAVSLSASLIISASIISNSIRTAGLTTHNSTTGVVVTTTPPADSTTATTVSLSLDDIKNIFKDNTKMKFGDENRKVLFVEFSDPSCPFCHAAAGKDPELNKQMGQQGYSSLLLPADGGSYIPPVPEMEKLVNDGKASYAWIYYPGHGNGGMGTQALYCANQMGKFWPVHDLLYSNAGYNLLNGDVKNDTSKSQELSDFLKDAASSSDMKSCLDSAKYKDRLTADPKLATDLKLTTSANWGTPGFIINSTYVEGGAVSYSSMQSIVNAALS